MSWESRAAGLHRIREHENDLGKLNEQLSNSRAEGFAWQQKVIDQNDVNLRETANLLTVTVNLLNDNEPAFTCSPIAIT